MDTKKKPHLPNGEIALIFPHEIGSRHNIDIIRQHLPTYNDFLHKRTSELGMADTDTEATSWALMGDKAYVGLMPQIKRCITPKKGKKLSLAEKNRNDKVGKDPIIIENFYGRLKISWKILRQKFICDEGRYDRIFDICAALTNFLVRLSPLREREGRYYQALKMELKVTFFLLRLWLSIQHNAEEAEKKRKENMKKWKERRTNPKCPRLTLGNSEWNFVIWEKKQFFWIKDLFPNKNHFSWENKEIPK